MGHDREREHSSDDQSNISFIGTSRVLFPNRERHWNRNGVNLHQNQMEAKNLGGGVADGFICLNLRVSFVNILILYIPLKYHLSSICLCPRDCLVENVDDEII